MARADAPGLAAISSLIRNARIAVPSIGASISAAAAQEDRCLIHEVNTSIGSKDDGNTFPGTSAPFGKIQISPIGSHYAGWRYDDPKVRGVGRSS